MTTSIEEMDRTVFEHIRRQLVLNGNLPDVKLFLTDPDGFEAAKAAMHNAGTLIEVFGAGSSEARDKKEVNRITILRKNTQRGTLGAFGLRRIERLEPDNPLSGYEAYRQPSGNKNILYEIRAITLSSTYERIAADTINEALGYGDYINIVDPVTLENIPDKLEFIAIMGDVDVSTTNFIEKLFTYQFTDVWVDKERLEPRGIVPIIEIPWNVTFSEGTPDVEGT